MSYHDDAFVERGWRLVVIVGCVSIAAVMQFLDSTIVNVALPVIAGNLGATFDQIGWVVTAYSLAAISVIPLTGWLAIRYGRRRYFVTSIVCFTAASALCGLSHTLGSLLAARVLQGLAGGGLVATSQAILVSTLPRQRQAAAQGIFAMIAVVGPALGPTLGGWLTDNFSWPLIFFINLPIGVAAAIVLGLMLRESPTVKRPVDVTGIVLLVSGLACLQYFLERGESKQWFDAPGIALAAAWAAVALVAFVIHTLRAAHPVLELRVLRHRNLAVGAVLSLAVGANLFGFLFLLPLYLQNLLGFTATLTGLMVLIRAAATAVLTPFATIALQRRLVEPRAMAGVGFAFLTLGTYDVARNVTSGSGAENFVWAMIFTGVAFALLWTPLALISLRSLPGSEIGYGAAIFNLSVQIGGSVGIAFVTTAQDRRLAYWWETVASNVTLGRTAVAQLVQRYGLTHTLLLRLNGLVEQQAYALTYRDLFLMLTVPVAVAIPLVLFARRMNAG
ncbi:MAG TPA: DHA2 family efflux MFS transporter permease subunit [Candidatus Dormibacteraeota bacterium]|nr:DHA2 family efflux MFS transporter permease subunit [Candidatus Dormibacteraeota bacterium]